MSNYMLYGSKIIEDDSTMKKFAESVFKNLHITYSGELSYEDFKEESLNIILCFIKDDVSRTDIDYENLMYKYRFDIGDLLYEMDNTGNSLLVLVNCFGINFFGTAAKTSFEDLINAYCDIHFYELLV